MDHPGHYSSRKHTMTGKPRQCKELPLTSRIKTRLPTARPIIRNPISAPAKLIYLDWHYAISIQHYHCSETIEYKVHLPPSGSAASSVSFHKPHPHENDDSKYIANKDTSMPHHNLLRLFALYTNLRNLKQYTELHVGSNCSTVVCWTFFRFIPNTKISTKNRTWQGLPTCR